MNRKLPRLTDCISRVRPATELLIALGFEIWGVVRLVEARDRFTQAVLGMDDWPLSIEEASLDQVLDCEEAKWVISTFGVGIDLGIGAPSMLDVANLRYGKIVIIMSSDETGLRLHRNLIAFLYRYMNALLASGQVYTVVVPAGSTESQIVEMAIDRGTRQLLPVKVAESIAETLRLNGA